jgi:hypothetical protein
MNFEDLMKKMKSIDEGQSVEECGMMPMSGSSAQQDNVTMNVSMNGSGAGGIRDLMAILKNIEDTGHDHDDILVGEPSKHEPVMGAMVQSMADEQAVGEEYENSVEGGSDPAVYGIDAVTQTGDDLHSKGREVPPVNGGGNPMQEALVSRLAQMYDEIKEGKKDKFDALKHVKNPTKGEKEAAKDVKRGSYADRAAMLKSAEADGRLKQEAYNPNSVDAEHRRGLEKSHEDSLKKKAADGDASAKKRLQALKDKKERMSNDYNDRMER